LNLYKNNGQDYDLRRSEPIHNFVDSSGNIDKEKVKYWVSGIMHVDHVLRTQTHILFVQTIEEANVIEEIEYDKKEQMDNI
tara:strand:+ start:1153 stop:1395 length:243 start_codon:yes stop_codon:yes gene_type:complete